MSFSPRYIGDTRAFNCTFLTDTSAFPSGFTAGDISIHFLHEGGTATTGSGSWGNVSGNTAQYTPSGSDAIVTTAGLYKCWCVIAGTTFDPQIIEVLNPSVF